MTSNPPPQMDLQELDDSELDLGHLDSPIGESHEIQWDRNPPTELRSNSVNELTQQRNETVKYLMDYETIWISQNYNNHYNILTRNLFLENFGSHTDSIDSSSSDFNLTNFSSDDSY
jgi:hypothetical protein